MVAYYRIPVWNKLETPIGIWAYVQMWTVLKTEFHWIVLDPEEMKVFLAPCLSTLWRFLDSS